MVKAAFLDRDDTLIKDIGYTFRTNDLVWKTNAILALSILSFAGYRLIVITNQSGIARGYFTEKEMNTFHQYMNNDLKQKTGIEIDKFYHCPHHSKGNIKKYRKKCSCRKPGTKLYKKAISDYDINVSHSMVIGNNYSDITPAYDLGVETAYLFKNDNKADAHYSNKVVHVKNWTEVIKNIENISDFVSK